MEVLFGLWDFCCLRENLRVILLSIKVSLSFTNNLNIDGLQCFSCNSNSDENCATLRLNITDAECDGNCAVWIVQSTTYRGCELDIPEEALNSEACESDGCNKMVFPEARFKCVKCSPEDANCASPDASLLYSCKNYVENDSCYTYVIGEIVVNSLNVSVNSFVDRWELCGSRMFVRRRRKREFV